MGNVFFYLIWKYHVYQLSRKWYITKVKARLIKLNLYFIKIYENQANNFRLSCSHILEVHKITRGKTIRKSPRPATVLGTCVYSCPWCLNVFKNVSLLAVKVEE